MAGLDPADEALKRIGKENFEAADTIVRVSDAMARKRSVTLGGLVLGSLLGLFGYVGAIVALPLGNPVIVGGLSFVLGFSAGVLFCRRIYQAIPGSVRHKVHARRAIMDEIFQAIDSMGRDAPAHIRERLYRRLGEQIDAVVTDVEAQLNLSLTPSASDDGPKPPLDPPRLPPPDYRPDYDSRIRLPVPRR